LTFWLSKTTFFNRTAVFDEEANNSFSYNELYSHINKVGQILHTNKKNLVLLLTDNSYSSIVLYLASIASDSAAMLVDAKTNKELISKIIEIYQPDFILSKSEIATSFGQARNIFMDKLNFYVLEAEQNGRPVIFKDLALLLSTSGTTGSSKFVRLTKSNILSNARSIKEYLSIDENQTTITLLPMQYSFGLSIINSHLLAGAKIVCTNKSIVEKGFWELFASQAVTTFSGVPYTYQILERIHFNQMKLPSLNYFTQAGGHLNAQSKRYFLDFAKEHKTKFIVMYGQTEATARISYVPFDYLEKKIDSIGIAIPDGIMEIIDEDGVKILEPNKTGELVYRGKNVMLGYATSRACLSKKDDLNGELRTGDLAKFDEDGFFYLTGRLKRFLKVFGNRINLDDIERMLEEQFGFPFAVTGIDDNVFILSEKFTDGKRVTEFLSSKLGMHFSAFHFKVSHKLPTSANGKKDYVAINNLFAKAN
jgi:long-chain acyl-CoA synthetase